MKLMRKIILALLITIMSASFAAADTIYLRNGQTVRGTVLGFVSGRFAVKLTAPFSPQANTQTGGQSSTQGRATNEIGDVVFIRPRDIERVEIEGRSIDEARYLTRTIQVELGPNWVDTGIDLRRGERVQVNASGTIVAGRSRITPGGLRSTDPNAPLPRAAEGVLIGAVGNDPNSPIIEIGLNREFVADRDGRLYLTANRSSYTDARGAFTAQVRREVNFNQGVAGNRRTDNTNDDNNDPNDLFGTGSSSSYPSQVRPRTSGGYPITSGGYPTTTSTERTAIERTIEVPGNSRGTDTGIDLRSGDSVTLTATGNVTAGRRAGVVSPDGGRVGFGGIAGTYPVAGAGVGALIGYIRLTNGQITQPFVVGSQQTLTASADGRLFLLINDDNYSDNSGSFSVRISSTSGSNTSTNSPSNSSGTAEKIINVLANSPGVDTGIDLRQEDNVTITATGNIFSRGTGAISPEGNSRYDSSAGSYPAPDAPFGALVGYIRMNNGRSTTPFAIGSQQTFSAPADGRLILMVNDDDYRDNSGSYRVRIVY
jgi:hypothetical protein